MLKHQELPEKESVRIKALHDAAWSLRQTEQGLKCSHTVLKCALKWIADTGAHKIEESENESWLKQMSDTLRYSVLVGTEERPLLILRQRQMLLDLSLRSDHHQTAEWTRLEGRIVDKKPSLGLGSLQKRLRAQTDFRWLEEGNLDRRVQCHEQEGLPQHLRLICHGFTTNRTMTPRILQSTNESWVLGLMNRASQRQDLRFPISGNSWKLFGTQ